MSTSPSPIVSQSSSRNYLVSGRPWGDFEEFSPRLRNTLDNIGRKRKTRVYMAPGSMHLILSIFDTRTVNDIV